MSSTSRSTALWLFVLAVDAMAVACCVFPPPEVYERNWLMLALLVVLAALTGSKPVRISALRVQLTASHPFVIFALGALGTVPAMITSIATVFGAFTSRSNRQRPIRALFNLGVQPLAAGLAGWVFFWAGGGGGQAVTAILGPLALATAVFFLVNTGLVSVAIALERNLKLTDVWKESFLWTGVSYLMGLTVAAVMMVIYVAMGPWGLLLAIPPCWLLVEFYRSHKERLEEHQRRIEEIEALNAELELKVAERTRELQDALGRVAQTNRQLREANTRLTEASRAKSAFLANVSHELRTPLNSIIGFSELLAQPSVGELLPRQRELLGDIHSSGEHLLSLINDILDLSKIEAGKLEIRRSPTPIKDMIERSTTMIRPQADKKSLTVELDVDPEGVVANLDPGMFRAVLVNLLSNGVKFTPDGGRIIVRVRAIGNDLTVDVEDTGIGISKEDAARVFQEFYQVDGSYSREYEGTGLGLALVKKMVTLHDGRVSVESEQGKGATFTCVYPDCLIEGPLEVPSLIGSGIVSEVSSEEPPAQEEEIAAAPAAAPRDPERGPSVLLAVAAGSLDRRLASSALRSRDFDTREAASEEETLQVVDEQRPDLIVLDQDLPGCEVLRLAKTLSERTASAGTTLILLARSEQQPPDEVLREVGIHAVAPKPVSLSKFPQLVASLMMAEEKVS